MPSFDLDLSFGTNWEDAFADIVGQQKIECKADRIAYKTGNIFVEYEYRGLPSGIAATDAAYWVIGIADAQGRIARALLASTTWLKSQCALHWNSDRNIRGGDNRQSRGVLVPIEAWGKLVHEPPHPPPD